MDKTELYIYSAFIIIGALLIIFVFPPEVYSQTYPTPVDTQVPLNAEYWGVTQVDFFNWRDFPDYGDAVAVCGTSHHSYDELYITAVNLYWIDMDTSENNIAQPYAKFALYTEGVKFAETQPQSIVRIDDRVHTGDGWNRFAFEEPVHWVEGETCILLNDYNGFIMRTSDYIPNLGKIGLVDLPTGSFLNPLPNTIDNVIFSSNKHLAVNIEYTEGVPIYIDDVVNFINYLIKTIEELVKFFE